MNKSSLLKTGFCILLVVSMCVLTACGGGGHSSNGGGESHASVKVTVPGALLSPSLRSNQTAALRADVDITKLILQTKAYLNGNLVSGVSIDNLQATLSGSNYVFEVKDLLNTYEYRFSALYNNKVILQNQVSQDQVTEGNEIPVDVTTSYKVLAYDAWIAENPSSKALTAFATACQQASITDFSALSTISAEQYQNAVKQIINGEEASIPTTENINSSELEKIPTTVDPNPVPTVDYTVAQHANAFRTAIFSIFACEQPFDDDMNPPVLTGNGNGNEISNMPAALKALAKGSEMKKYIPDTVEEFQNNSNIANQESAELHDNDWPQFSGSVRSGFLSGIIDNHNVFVAIAKLNNVQDLFSNVTLKMVAYDKYAIGLGYFTVNGKEHTFSLVLQRLYKENPSAGLHNDDFHLAYGKIWLGKQENVDFDTNDGNHIAKIEKNLNANEDFDATKIVYTNNKGETYTHWYSVNEGQEGGDGENLFPNIGN